MSAKTAFDSIDQLAHALEGVGYFAERRLITAVFLSLRLERPLLLEGSLGWAKPSWPKPWPKCWRVH